MPARSGARGATRALRRYLFALGVAALALAATAAVAPYLERTIFIFGFPAVALAAWYGGRGPALLAAAVSLVGVHLLLVAPFGPLAIPVAVELAGAALFAGVSLLIATVCGSLRSSRAAAGDALERVAFLARAGEALARSLDYETTLRRVAALAVPRYGDWCAVDLLEPDGSLNRLAITHIDPQKIELARELQRRYPPRLDAEVGVGAALRSRTTLRMPDVDDAMLRAGAQDDEHYRVLKALDIRSALVVPLVAHDETLGAITFVHAESGRRYDDADVAFAEDLARRAALAIHNARVVRDLSESRARLEQSKVQLEEQAAELEMQTEELQSMMQELETAADDLRAANEHIEQARVEAEHGRAAADAANRTKSEFLAAMSHELRTPLNAIAGYTDLLETGVYGGLDERQRGALERIRRNQHHLLALINNVLNFSRLEAGRIDLDIRPVSIEETVRDLHVLVEPQLRTQQLDYEFAGCDAGEAALGDREKIEQILLNLITNAIKFTPPGGRITITCDAADDTVAITVRDTGRGVPADRLAAIFEPFIQIDAVHTRESGGVGLGLSISRDLARLMDGDVTAASRVGEGSTFTLTLPRAAQAEVPQQDSPAGGGPGHAG